MAHPADRNILLIEDDVSLRSAIISCLTRSGYGVEAFESGDKAVGRIGPTHYDLVLSDVMMPGLSGYDLLDRVKRSSPDLPVILMTAYGTIEKAVDAMKKGAYDFLVKPFSLQLLETTVRSAFIDIQSREEKEKREPSWVGEELITRDPGLLEILENLKKVAPSKATVVIQGESGTGKELLARMLHEFSPRASHPFVAINCAAMPDNLLESELFGHERGAFTGAVSQQIGKFEASNNGTILLDEVTEMSLNMQTKLLRVLQECEIYRVGGVKAVPLNIRVVTTTNRNLYQHVKEGHFREDLYYRINVIPILVPPLRERGGDILILAEHFLKEFARRHRKTKLSLDEGVKKKLVGARWHGNVRELRNVMERVTLTGHFDELDEILASSASHTSSGEAPVPPSTLNEMEKRHILETLARCGGNRTKTALELGISLRTLRNKLKSYGEGEVSGVEG